MIIGMFYSNFSIRSFLYIVFLVLLIPGILVAASVDNLDFDLKKAIAFNLSGSLCLAIASMYMYKKSCYFQNCKMYW